MLWTGSRAWSDSLARWTTLAHVALPVAYGLMDAVPDRLGFMHGGAQGLDAYVHELTQRRAFAAVTPEVYPPMLGEDPLDRDLRMIENKPGMVVGLPHPSAQTGGTWTTLRLAYAAGIPAYVCREMLGTGWTFQHYTPRGHRHRHAEATLW